MSEIILKIEKQTIKAQISNTELPNSYDNIQCVLKDIAHYYPNLIQISQTNQNTHISINILLRIIAEETNILIIFGILGGALKTTFKQGVVLQCRHFMQDVSFQECEFEDNFSAMGCNFHKDILFDKAEFQRFFIASKSIFHKQVSFWNAKFSEIPNFSGVGFIECNLVNFVNTKIKKDSFGDLVQLTENETGHLEQNKAQSIIKDLRDSYRAVKNSLIRQNNLLDASNWHKLELYTKEIELDSKKPNIFSRDWIDKLVLRFYRHTSDHHTDLLRIWHSLLIVVGIFGILSSGVIVVFDYLYLKLLNFDAHSLIEIYNAHIKHYVLTHSYPMLGINALLLIGFVVLFMLNIWCSKVRVVEIFLSYCVAILLFVSSPKYLIPAIGIFTDKRSMLDPLSMIGGIYTILFALMLYSLIKTARKNSIVPS